MKVGEGQVSSSNKLCVAACCGQFLCVRIHATPSTSCSNPTHNIELVAERALSIGSANVTQTKKPPLITESANDLQKKRDEFEVHSSDDEIPKTSNRQKQLSATKSQLSCASSNDEDILALEEDEPPLSNDLSISFDDEEKCEDKVPERSDKKLTITIANHAVKNRQSSPRFVTPRPVAPNEFGHQSHSQRNVKFNHSQTQSKYHNSFAQCNNNNQFGHRPKFIRKPNFSPKIPYSHCNVNNNSYCNGPCCERNPTSFHPYRKHGPPVGQHLDNRRVVQLLPQHCSTVVDQPHSVQHNAESAQSANNSSGKVTLSIEEYTNLIANNNNNQSNSAQTVTIQNGQVALPIETFKDLVVNKPPPRRRNRPGHGQRMRMKKAIDNQKKKAMGFEYWYKH